MNRKIKVGIIGFGNMGGSCASALNERNQYKVFIYDAERRKRRKAKSFSVTKDIAQLIAAAEIVILAIKPQNIGNFLAQNKEGLLKRKPLLVSVAAGISASWLQGHLKGIRIIRVMPNLAAKVGESLSFISKGKNAKKSDLAKVERIFSCIGEVIVVEEKYLDKVTGISGSGPGYVFYFMESMYQGALKLGFTKKEAKRMITQTFLGASKLAKASKEEFKTLIKEVASKKGTTEAALKVFKKKKVDKAIIQGMDNACRKSREISGKLTKKRFKK